MQIEISNILAQVLLSHLSNNSICFTLALCYSLGLLILHTRLIPVIILTSFHPYFIFECLFIRMKEIFFLKNMKYNR